MATFTYACTMSLTEQIVRLNKVTEVCMQYAKTDTEIYRHAVYL